MKLLKTFLAFNLLMVISILAFIASMQKNTAIPMYKINNVIESYFKMNYSNKNILKMDDLNSIKFDDIVNIYCSVNLLNHTNECLKYLSTYNTSLLNVEFNINNQIIHYHTFWKPIEGKGHHNRVMKLNILSFLATQDLKHAKLIIWSVKRLEVESELRNEFQKYVNTNLLEFKALDYEMLCSNGIFLLRKDECRNMNHGNNILLSDFVRFLVLYNYGGIYVDGDVIFLRDMKPLWTKNFLYRWSFLHSYNTAVMGIQEFHSEFIEKIYEIIIVEASNTKSLVDGFYPTNIKDVVMKINDTHIFNYTDFDVYSSVLFDPAWLCFDVGDKVKINKSICSFQEFYDLSISEEEFSMSKFFPGAFTYHLHLGSCGTCKINSNSYFYHIEKYFKSKLKNFIQ